MGPMASPVEFIGVYDADGGVRGELTYVVAHLLRRAQCGLCEVTHSGVRRKREWDQMAGRLPVPIRLAHRNELTDQERHSLQPPGLPVVLGRLSDGSHVTVLSTEQVNAAGGSVQAFEAALTAALAQREGGLVGPAGPG